MNKIKVIKNNLKALKNYRQKKVLLDNMPTYFWIEPTNHCNLRCIMCPTGAGKVGIEKGYMGFAFYKDIIDQIADFASAVTLAVNGESLLHPDFFDMVHYTVGKGIKVLLNTNATLLDKERAELMLESGLAYVSFAFDGFNKLTYEKTRVGSDFDKTLENIIYFLKLKKRKNRKLPYAVLSILKLGTNECSSTEEKRAFFNKFKDLIDEIRLRDVSTWGNTFIRTKEFSFRKCILSYPPCSRLWSSAVICYNGDVVPCIYNSNHEYVVGSLKEKAFEEIWNSEKMLSLRHSMLDGSYLEKSPLCEHCIVLGTPPICGIPSGLRLTSTDSVINVLGFGFEKYALRMANKFQGGKFPSIAI